MNETPSADVSRILSNLGRDGVDESAELGRLSDLVDAELNRICAELEGRAHFFAIAATAMRWIQS